MIFVFLLLPGLLRRVVVSGSQREGWEVGWGWGLCVGIRSRGGTISFVMVIAHCNNSRHTIKHITDTAHSPQLGPKSQIYMAKYGAV